MENRRPQLDSQTLHQVRWLLGGVLSLVAAWTVFYMEVEASVLLLVTTVAVPLATWRPAWAASVPTWIHRLAFPAVAAMFALDFYQAREPLPAMVRLGLMLLLYRSVTMRTRREDSQLIVLALFLVVVAGVLTVSLLFVAQILLFTVCALALLLAITLSDAAEDAARPATWVRVEWRVVFRRLLAVTDWRVVSLGSAMFAGVLGLSALLFMAIPRFDLESNFFLEQLLSVKAKSGFSETVTFGSVVDIQQDRSLALSVDVTEPGRVPATPYWRMLVLDDYMDGVFSMSRGLREEFDSMTEKLGQHTGGASASANAPVWTFYLEGGVSRYLPLVGPYERISFSKPQALQVNRTQRLVALASDQSKMLGYRVEGMLPEARVEDAALASRLRRRLAAGGEAVVVKRPMSGMMMEEYYERAEPPIYLELALSEPDVARLLAWVEEIGAPANGDVEGFVRRACAWLERRHGYSLRMALPPGEGDRLVRWMDSPEPGHCELFAGSLVALCRAAGVPARVVVGFKGGVWNQNSGSILVTNADAHAWVEVFDGERFWLRADPTPGAGGLNAGQEAAASANGAPRLEVDSGWSARLNGLRMFWYRRIVSFDQTSQLDMVRSAGRWVESYGKRLLTEVDNRLRAIGEWLARPWSLGRVGAGVGLLAGAAALVWIWRRINVGAWWRALRGADPVRREAGRWLRRMEAAGVPTEDAVRAELLRLRYGRRTTWAPSAEVFRAAKRRLRRRKRGEG